MTCDHKWGSGGNEYSKKRTERWPKLGTIEVCDMCKIVLKDGKEIGRMYYYPSTKELFIVDSWSVLDRTPSNYTADADT